MEAIKLRQGKLYVEHRGLTVRFDDEGNGQRCPQQLLDMISYAQTLPADDWWELDEAQIRALPGGIYEKTLALVRQALEEEDGTF